MFHDYIGKDVEIDNDLITSKMNVNDYVCECQYGQKVEIQGGSKHQMEKPPWDPT